MPGFFTKKYLRFINDKDRRFIGWYNLDQKMIVFYTELPPYVDASEFPADQVCYLNGDAPKAHRAQLNQFINKQSFK